MYTRARAAAAAVSISLAVAVAVAVAPASWASDASATHAYIQANYALAKAGVGNIPSTEAKVGALNTSLSQQCPAAGNGAPELESTQPVSQEVVAALWAIVYGTNAKPIATFVAKTKHLRWSNAKITRIVSHYAKSLHEMSVLPMPSICEDVRAFAAGGFKTAPSHVVSLVEHVEAIELEPVPGGLLSRFEHGSDKSLFAKTAKLETKLEEQEFAVGQTDWLEILGTLGLPQ